jgi:hypothetical protein
MSFFVSRWRDNAVALLISFAERRSARAMPIWQWAIAGLGFVLVLGSIFYLVYRGLQNSRS